VVLGNDSVVFDIGARFDRGAKFIQAEDATGAKICSIGFPNFAAAADATP
jgi:hypothetical protein